MVYDYIFCGAGCAGLSLISHLAQDEFFDSKRILVLDQSDKTENDRTWCFWSESDFGYKASRMSWKEITFRTDRKSIQEDIHPFSYYHIEGKNFYSEIFQLIDKNEHIDFVKCQVKSITEKEDGVTVFTADKTYQGKLAFNSITSLAFNKLPKIDLWQHFYGYRLITQDPFFNQKAVTLMDFSVGKNKDRVQFGYVLPFNQHEALVEYTEFSPDVLKEEEYIDEITAQIKALGLKDFEIKQVEIGKIPMSSLPKNASSKNIIHLGTAAGLTKPTTGYTFRNIQIDSKDIIGSLKKEQRFKRDKRKRRFSFYDSLLLGIIKDEPHQVKKIMSKLFGRNKFRRILNFLDENSSLWDEIRIFTSIPWGPFLRQLAKK